jgi:hypothetical protein
MLLDVWIIRPQPEEGKDWKNNGIIFDQKKRTSNSDHTKNSGHKICVQKILAFELLNFKLSTTPLKTYLPYKSPQ